MKTSLLNEAIEKLNNYCIKNNYKGYSLYDSHTSQFHFIS